MARMTREYSALPEPRRILRCRRTGRFYRKGGWTKYPDRAECFLDELAAVRACLTIGPDNVEVVLNSA